LDDFEYLVSMDADQNDYEYKDESLFSTGTYYYRIKEVYHNGTIEYSRVLQEDVSLINKPKLNIFPNPTPDFLNIMTETSMGDLTIRIVDASGKEFLKNQIETTSQETLNTIDMTFLNSGVYFISLSGENYNETHKVIKQ